MDNKYSFIGIGVIVVVTVVALVFFGNSDPQFAGYWGSCNGGSCSADDGAGNSCSVECSKGEMPQCKDDPVYCFCHNCENGLGENLVVIGDCDGGGCYGDGCGATCSEGSKAMCDGSDCKCVPCDDEEPASK
jgi:hypothetical protein